MLCAATISCTRATTSRTAAGAAAAEAAEEAEEAAAEAQGAEEEGVVDEGAGRQAGGGGEAASRRNGGGAGGHAAACRITRAAMSAKTARKRKCAREGRESQNRARVVVGRRRRLREKHGSVEGDGKSPPGAEGKYRSCS